MYCINKTICGLSSLISSDSYLVRIYEFTDETPQIHVAEEQHIITMDKAAWVNEHRLLVGHSDHVQKIYIPILRLGNSYHVHNGWSVYGIVHYH